MTKRLAAFFYSLFSNKYFTLSIWVIVAVYYGIRYAHPDTMNNYLIFKYTYLNAVDHLNLYAQYPQHYDDSNHYGPIFSLIMTPFALLPGNWGAYLWQVCNTLLLFFAIQQLPLDNFKKNLICIICLQELIICLKEFQTNGAIAALIILAWVMVEKKKDFWATLFIMLGLFVKLYGIIGIVFFLFSKQKKTFILSAFFWAAVLFVLPMIFFSPSFIAQSYVDWYHSLRDKNAQNISMGTLYQDISVMGMVRRLAGHRVAVLPFLVTGAGLFMASCFNLLRADALRLKLLLLSSSLLVVVLFSTGSEYPTYIIAFAGIATWFMSAPRPLTKYQIGLFVFAIYFGSLYRTDLFPGYIKNNIIFPYALKALPCVIIWLAIVAEMIKYTSSHQPVQNTADNIDTIPLQKNYR